MHDERSGNKLHRKNQLAARKGTLILRIPGEVLKHTFYPRSCHLEYLQPHLLKSKAIISSHTQHAIPSAKLKQSSSCSCINETLFLAAIHLPFFTVILRVLGRPSLALAIRRSCIEFRKDLGWDTVEEFLRVDTQQTPCLVE